MGLDNSARMNVPGTVDNNWKWRLTPDQLPKGLEKEILEITKRFGRFNWDILDRREREEETAE
jgi:4-alpha-glucanotransferase